jgi:hypothetical protein
VGRVLGLSSLLRVDAATELLDFSFFKSTKKKAAPHIVKKKAINGFAPMKYNSQVTVVPGKSLCMLRQQIPQLFLVLQRF